MKRVVVTGGSGKAGRAVVADLVEHGYDVLNVDIGASLDPDQPTRVADLTDLAHTMLGYDPQHSWRDYVSANTL